MSYARWSYSDWYIYWDACASGATKAAQSLAVWTRFNTGKPLHFVSYDDAVHILATKDGSSIPGWAETTDAGRAECLDCIQEWVQDCDYDFDGVRRA